jgi:hypothetical protein
MAARPPIGGGAPVRGLVAALIGFLRSLVALRCGAVEAESKEKWWVLGFTMTDVGFDRVVKPCSRRMRMGSHDQPDRSEWPN